MAERERGRIFTVGHSTRSLEELVELLCSAGVQAVADVRASPGSRRHPHWGAAAMAESLPPTGIRYLHLRELGGRRKPIAGSVNAGWRETAFQGYADYMASPDFGRAIGRLEDLARHHATSIMCAEALWWRCHRRLIADALTVRGWQVEHLGVASEPRLHELPPFAVVKDGVLSYPPPQRSLFS
jgi:uncharacterized protein (DUF488 family)